MIHPFPHRYAVRASGLPDGLVSVQGNQLPPIQTSAPPEFDGPEGNWSPESLLVAAVADCFVLSFRAVARASSLSWRNVDVSVEGVLERSEGVTRFTRFTLAVTLAVGEGVSDSLAGAAVGKAKRACLVTNSLKAECELTFQILQPEAQH